MKNDCGEETFLEVIWKIENFVHCWHENYQFLQTGYIGLESKCDSLELRIHPKGQYGGGVDVDILLMNVCVDLILEPVFSLLVADNFIPIPFTELCKTGPFCSIRRKQIFENAHDYLPQGHLTIRFRCKYKYLFSQHVVFNSLIKYSENSAVWTIDNFESNSRCLGPVAIPINCNDFDWVRNLILKIFYLNSDGGEWIEFEIPESIGTWFLKCRLYIQDSGELYLFIEKTVRGSEKFLVKPILSRSQLFQKKTSIANGTLYIKCEITFVSMQLFTTKTHGAVSLTTKSLIPVAIRPEKVMEPFQHMKDDFLQLYENNVLSDLQIKLQDDSFLVHSAILAARSPVFQQMLETDMREKNSRIITIDDLDKETCSRMLRYFYSADLGNIDVQMACKLYYAADKYLVHALKIATAHFLKRNLDPGNVFDVLILADTHQDGDFKKFLIDYICRERKSFSEEIWHSFFLRSPRLAAHVTLAIAQF